MIQELISLVHELFPSINPYTKDQVKFAVRQFESSGRPFDCFMNKPLDYLAQGDIIDSLSFTLYDKDGNRLILKTKGLLLSNSCDAENDDSIIFAPVLPIEQLSVNKVDVKKNLRFSLLYFPDPRMSDFVIDLSIVNTFSKQFILGALEKGRLNKLVSLNTFGYYLFLCKLTVHLMRPEDTTVQKERAS